MTEAVKELERLHLIDMQEVLIFVSDIHLSPDASTSDDASGFLKTLEQSMPVDCSRLFILGDLFETWVGDDVLTRSRDALRHALTRMRSRGDKDLKCYLMHGNRDFLIGERLCRELDAQWISDSFILECFGQRAGLCHGDALCIDDLDYQHFRRLVRAADWQKAFLSKPLAEREAIAQGLRHQSERSKQEKSMAIMDVNTQAVHEFVADQGIETLIHGHTHRPGRHHSSFTRWVLPDWDLAQKRGGWLRWDRTGLTSQGPFGAWT